MKNLSQISLVVLRISLGFVFLWAFFDKLFGLGFSTQYNQSWLAGSSPTSGYLTHGARGPFAEYFTNMSGSVQVDWLFMMGLLGVGLALVLGIGMLVAAIAGSMQMLLIYLSSFPPENNPLVDQHIIYVITLWVLYQFQAGDTYGFGIKWQESKLVKRFPWLI